MIGTGFIEILDKLFDYYDKKGLSVLMSLLFLTLIVFGIFALFKYINIKNKEESVLTKGMEVLKDTMVHSVEGLKSAVESIDNTNKNLNESLKVLIKSVEQQSKLVDIIHKENGDIQNRLLLHDDRSEKILTYEVLNTNMLEHLAKELNQPISKEVKEELKEKAEDKVQEFKDKEII